MSVTERAGWKVIDCPQQVQHALVREFRVLTRQPHDAGPLYTATAALIGGSQSPFITEGQEWRAQRDFLKKYFDKSHLAQYRERVKVHADRTVNRWQEGKLPMEVDIMKEMRYLTLDIMADTLFGLQMTHRDWDIFLGEYHTLNGVVEKWMAGTKDPEDKIVFATSLQGVQAFAAEIIRRRAELPPRGDLLSESIQRCSSGEVQALVHSFLIAGHENIASLMAKTVYIASMHQQGSHVEWEDIVQHLLRTEPPVPYIFRYAHEAVTIGNQEVSPGDQVILSLMSGEQGNTLAFGYGPHQCLGKQLALIECQEIIPVLLSRVGITANGEYQRSNRGALSKYPESLPVTINHIIA